ncbi:MAG: SDR family NAD(P)-dependent oxidoreductase [Verrucomicrobiota bacterium]|nr:SDR family NAD(P)-dependent oxidoreductase [Verrucomicrobiota bacterium]
MSLKGKTALVTGGARGIGLATVQRLLQEGASCIIWDCDQTAIELAKTRLANCGEVTSDTVDLAKSDSVDSAACQAIDRHGHIDILVNNAGIAGVNKMLWECTPEEWRKVIDIDLYGVFLCCRVFVPGMLESGWGRIVNIASIAGKEGNPTASHYSAAKAGVIGLTKSLGKELAETNIRVNCITPAVIETEILKQCTQEHIDYMVSKIPMRRVGQADEVAALIAWLSSNEVSFSTGAVFDISGGRATY